jgi:Domain of unknown function (DUF2017)
MNVAITPAGGGAVMVDLPDDLRDLLASLAKQLTELIDDPDAADDPGMARLFPPASVDDPMEALGFEQLMGDAIKQGKRESASVLRATAHQNRLSPDETLAWMRCLNDIRLLIGTRLDVQEDSDFEAMVDDPLLEQAAIIYISLSELVGMLSLAADPT